MELQEVARVDMIVRASRWERVKLFFRYASGWTVVWSLCAVAVVPIACASLVIGKAFPWPALWVVIGAAAGAAVDMGDPYQRLALLGGTVYVCYDADRKRHAFMTAVPAGRLFNTVTRTDFVSVLSGRAAESRVIYRMNADEADTYN